MAPSSVFLCISACPVFPLAVKSHPYIRSNDSSAKYDRTSTRRDFSSSPEISINLSVRDLEHSQIITASELEFNERFFL